VIVSYSTSFLSVTFEQRCPWRRCRCHAAFAVAVAAIYFSLPSRPLPKKEDFKNS